MSEILKANSVRNFSRTFNFSKCATYTKIASNALYTPVKAFFMKP